MEIHSLVILNMLTLPTSPFIPHGCLVLMSSLLSSNPFVFVFSGASNMVTGETKSFFSFAKSVSQKHSLSSIFEGNSTCLHASYWNTSHLRCMCLSGLFISAVVAGGEGQPY